ncbi:MAG: ecotin family protein [Thiohalomonadales bacterium]
MRLLITTNRLAVLTLSLVVSQWLLMGALFIPNFAHASDRTQLKAFPPAEETMLRYVIFLEHKERLEEDAFKVELVAGKTLLTDGVNQVRMGLSISAKPLKGWGYTFYEVTGTDAIMSTLMAAPEGAEKVEEFVAGAPLIIRYNSRLPIVVYAPEGVLIRYRVWKAGEVFLDAVKE